MFRRFCFFVFLACFVGCASQSSRHFSSQIRNIRNSDVRWDGTFMGLRPSVSGASKGVLNQSQVDFNELVEALHDENRFVAAHVLLTERTGFLIESPRGVDPESGKLLPGSEMGGTFNGLRVDVFPNGTAVIHENQRAKLVSRWMDWRKRMDSWKSHNLG